MLKHEDNRRTLIEWITDKAFRSAKVVIAKENCIVGDHHHKKKDETFFLLQGSGVFRVAGEIQRYEAPQVIHVPRGTYHRFNLAEGTILLGVATAPFSDADEIPGQP